MISAFVGELMAEVFVINSDHFIVLEPQANGVTGHYVRLQAPEKLKYILKQLINV